MGDFFLFLTKVDQLDYNILEEEENLKKKFVEEELSGVQNNAKSSKWFIELSDNIIISFNYEVFYHDVGLHCRHY